MRRRKVCALLAGALAPWPLITFGQSVTRPRTVGVLMGLAETDPEISRRMAIFGEILKAQGRIEGDNIRIQYRSAIEADRIRMLGSELVALQPDVIVAAGSMVASALLRETHTIPVLFLAASDPVSDGLVASLAQPNGNATGFTGNLSSLCDKWLEILQEIAPGTTHVTTIFNPDSAAAGGRYFLPPLQTATASASLSLDVAPVHDLMEIEAVLATRKRGCGVIVLPDRFTSAHRQPIVESAARYRIPAIYPLRSFADAGGLISYGIDMLDLYGRAAVYVHRMLQGARPADLPVQSPGKVEMVINLRVARMLDLAVPQIMLVRADEVIE
jgi:putative tryptophan/tyrosine transport system substrate-binding protein